ncbi:hypothetical protein IAR50_000798 [Cryptococcus sp. DSM 104548]
MSEQKYALARVSICSPRLVPAGTPPKDIKWESYVHCTMSATPSPDGSSLQLEMRTSSTSLVSRTFLPIATLPSPVFRRITYTDKQAAFRYDWPAESPQPPNTKTMQECFQLIFKEPADLTSLLKRLGPFFFATPSTVKPITLTVSQAAPAVSTAKLTTKSGPLTKRKTAPKSKAKGKKGQGESTPSAGVPGLPERPAEGGDTNTQLSDPVASCSTSRHASIPPLLPHASARSQQTTPMVPLRDATNIAPGPSSNLAPVPSPPAVLDDPKIAALKKKLLAGHVVTTAGPRVVHTKSPPAHLAATPSVVHPPFATYKQQSTHDAQVSSQLPAKTPFPSRGAVNPTKSPNLICLSSPLISTTPAPPPTALASNPFDDLFELDGSCMDFAPMLTREQEAVERKRRLEEDDLDEECAVSRHDIDISPAHQSFQATVALVVGFGSPIHQLAEKDLDDLIGTCLVSEGFNLLYEKVSYLLSRRPSFQPCEWSTPSLGASLNRDDMPSSGILTPQAEPYTQSFYDQPSAFSQFYTYSNNDTQPSFVPETPGYSYLSKRPYCDDIDNRDDQGKRIRMYYMEENEEEDV